MKTQVPVMAVVACCLVAGTARASWQAEIGFTRLQSLAGGELPTATGLGLAHIEASVSATGYVYAPDTASPVFAGKSFTFKSGPSPASWHANHVAINEYSTTSVLPGASAVDLYLADDWIGTGFLNIGDVIAPLVETRAVQNHSWIASVGVYDTEATQRLDFAINRDGFVCVVGENNGNTTTLPELLGQTYHTISVGRDDGAHSAGFTSIDGSGRIKPDLVAPSASPEDATSWTTPMVSGAAGLLHAKLSAAPYGLSGADLPRVVKALLLAGATKNTVPSWSNTTSRPYDLRYGAGELNLHHAYCALRAGRATASNSAQYPFRGWAAESVPGNSSKTYFVHVAPGAPSTPFCATLTWHRVISDGIPNPNIWGNLSVELANLNLKLHQASGFSVGSQVAASQSTVDNVELVYQPSLPPGDYALVVENTSATATPYALAWHALPAVTVAATAPVAHELGVQPGTVTVTRTGDTALPLHVPLTIGGTAVAGTHYLALPASVTIPAGLTETTVQVTPIADSLAQGDRTVTVAVAADFALTRDPAQSAVVTIADKPYDAWRFARFTTAENADPGTSGETADPDGDHLANLVEYALALAPKSPSVSPLSVHDSETYLTISATKNPSATDITWSAQASSDLNTWDDAVTVTDTPTYFEARDLLPRYAYANRFLRLKITRP